MKPTNPTRTILLLALTPLLAGTLPAQEEDPPAPPSESAPEAPEARAAAADDVAWARALVEAWPGAKYKIMRGKRRLGTYEQRNSLTMHEGTPMLEYHDVVRYSNQPAPYQVQSFQELEPGLPTVLYQAVMNIDGIRAVFDEGRARGVALMKKPFDLAAPRLFVTETALLRGQPRIPRVEGESAELDFVDIVGLPKETAVRKGHLRCMGREDVEIAGAQRSAWKYRWQAEGKRPTLLWYGEHGELLRRQSRQEVWIFTQNL